MPAVGQSTADWKRIGNSAMEVSLPGLATGPIDRVWFSDDGSIVYARAANGAVWQTRDLEIWTRAATAVPVPAAASARTAPESGARIRGQARGRLIYAVGRFVYKSEDEGQSWANLTGYQGSSLIGDGVTDLAVSPRNEQEILVASKTGLWRSIDGGASWSGLNDALPNLAVRRILGLPNGASGLRIAVDGGAGLEWAPGERTGWRPAAAAEIEQESLFKQSVSAQVNASVTAVAVQGEWIYAGTAQGQLFGSSDRGRTWRPFSAAGSGAVERIWVSADEPRVALAAIARNGDQSPRVVRTMNGGVFWDDLTANLPAGSAHGVTADLASGAVYAATDAGVFLTMTDLRAAGPATQWTAVSGLPEVPAWDVKLDAAGNRLFAGLEAYGVYVTLAPHRSRDPKVASAADYASRAAAPGALLSIVGAKLTGAAAGQLKVPVLSATESESQIQVPFEAQGAVLPLSVETGSGKLAVPVTLQAAVPVIFLDRDGSPLVLDDSGTLLDAMRPARSRARLQILATGLGRVSPDWPTGLAAPLEDPPKVLAPVKAYLDRVPVEVVRATLAPGYTGFYLIEIELPALVNYGPAELYLEVGGQASNRVRVYIEP
jgi:uncharacterized protein (TIGR03437 family)